MKLIDMEKVLSELCLSHKDIIYIDKNETAERIRKIPSIDIVPKQGEWIPCTKSGLPLTELMRREGQKWYGYRCSNCNHIYKGNALTDCNFCPNCGADMRGADDGQRTSGKRKGASNDKCRLHKAYVGRTII